MSQCCSGCLTSVVNSVPNQNPTIEIIKFDNKLNHIFINHWLTGRDGVCGVPPRRWYMRHFLYSALTASTRRFQYLPSSKMASVRLCCFESTDDENWQTTGLRPAISTFSYDLITSSQRKDKTKANKCIHWICHARQMILLSRILSFICNLRPLNVFHLGEVILPL